MPTNVVTLREYQGSSGLVYELRGNGDPAQSPGARAPVGSCYLRFDNGLWYLKTGSADTSWIPSSGGSGGTTLGYYNVLDYGLLGDGSTDNRVALQSLVDTVHAAGGGTVFFPPGDYVIGQKPTAGATNKGSILFGGSIGAGQPSHAYIYLTGVGRDSRLIMTGSVNRAQTMFFMATNCHNIHFSNLFFISGVNTNTDEQVHMLEFGAGALFSTGPGPKECSVRNCRFGWCRGDSIRILGEAANPVYDIHVTDSWFNGDDHSANDGQGIAGQRSCIGIQRSSHRLIIANNQFQGAHDQLIDYEPSGAQEDNSHTIITGNTLVVQSQFTGALACTLGGDNASERNARFIFANNQVINGRIFCYNSAECQIVGNVIYADTNVRSDAALNFLNNADQISIVGNYIFIPANSGAEAGITLGGSATQVCDGAVLSNNFFRIESTKTNGSAILLKNAGDATISGNKFWFTAPATSANAIATTAQITASGRRITVTGNNLRNDGGNAMDSFFLMSPDAGITPGQVTLTGNSGHNLTRGYWHTNAGNLPAFPPVITGNDWPDATTPISILKTNMLALVGGNGGSTATYITQPNGDPNGQSGLDGVPIGSLYLDRATDGEKIWIKQVSGSNGWTPAAASLVVSKTATYTATLADGVILMDATGAARTVNLPTAASAKFHRYVVKKIDSSGNTVTIDPSGTETLDGATTLVLSTQWASAIIQSDGTAWFKLN